MSHQHLTDDLVERAALYAIGALDPKEAAAFEAHLAEGCAACAAEIGRSAVVADHLRYAVPPERPRAEVRDRILAYAAGADLTWAVVRATDVQWAHWGIQGAMIARLWRDPATRRFTALIRVDAGVRFPSHRHADTEELYLLAGDLVVEGQLLLAGDYCAALAGTVHGATESRGGCTFLLAASEQDQVTDDATADAQASGLVFVRASEGGWEPTSVPGITRREIFSDPTHRTTTSLVRMDAGARLPRHQHLTVEQFYLLEGDGHVTGEVLRAGDYYRTAAGTVHDVTYTEGGCTFLVISSAAVLT